MNPEITLTTRATLFSAPVAWTLVGDRLIRVHAGTIVEIPLTEVTVIQAWRSIRSRGLGGHRMVRLVTRHGSWTLTAHHAAGFARVEQREGEILVLVRNVVERLCDLHAPCRFRTGSRGTWLAAWLLLTLAVGIAGLGIAGFVVHPPVYHGWQPVLAVLAAVVVLAYKAWRCWLGGRVVTRDAEGFLVAIGVQPLDSMGKSSTSAR